MQESTNAAVYVQREMRRTNRSTRAMHTPSAPARRRRRRRRAPHSVERLEARRLLAYGDLAPSCGGDGTVTRDFFGGNDQALAVAVQPDGKILAAGTIYHSGSGAVRAGNYAA